MTNSENISDTSSELLGIHDELDSWDQTVAFSLAINDDLQLTEPHFEVLMYLRQCYQKFGSIRHARSLTQALAIRYTVKGGLKYLYQLFPGGPVSQGCKLAGLPIPGGAKDNSFGTML